MLRSKWRDQRTARRQEATLQQIWTNFQRYPSVCSGIHDTEDWRSRGGYFAACIVRIPCELLEPALSNLRLELEPVKCVRVHPDYFLHIMLQELGYLTSEVPKRDEITPERLEEVATAIAAALSSARAFDLRLGGANAFRDAIFLDVHDRGELARLHSLVHELAAVPPTSRYAYLPHMTVAHFTDSAPMGDLTHRLGKSRNVHFGTVGVNQIEIVELRVDFEYPKLETISTIPIGEHLDPPLALPT